MSISFGKEKSECFPFNKFFFFTMKMGHFLVHLEFCNKADTVCAIIRMGGMLSCMESDIVRGSAAGIPQRDIPQIAAEFD